GAEFIEETARVGLHCILTDEKPVSYLAVAETLRDQLEDLELAFGDAELSLLFFIDGERVGGDRYGHFPDDLDFLQQHDLFLAREFESEPDAEGREQRSDKRAVDLDRVLDNEEAKLDQSKDNDQHTARDAIDKG